MQIRNITWECPNCRARLKPTEFRIVWGSGGKRECPSCNVELNPSPAYVKWVLLALLPILCFYSFREGLRISVFIEGFAAWFLGSILLAVFCSWIWPPRLKAAKPDKNGPVQLFSRKRK